MTSTAVKLTVTYNTNEYSFQLLRSKMDWERIMMILQASIPELNNECIFYHKHLEGVPISLSGQEDLDHLLNTIGEVDEMHFYDCLAQEKSEENAAVAEETAEETQQESKEVPSESEEPANATAHKSAFQLLEDFVAHYKNEIQANEKLSKTVGYLASRIVRWPHENFSAEFKLLEEWLKPITAHSERSEKKENSSPYAEFTQKGWDLLNAMMNPKEKPDPQEWVESFVAILVDTYEKRTHRPIQRFSQTLKEHYTHQEEALSDLHKRTIHSMNKMMKRAHSFHTQLPSPK